MRIAMQQPSVYTGLHIKAAGEVAVGYRFDGYERGVAEFVTDFWPHHIAECGS